MSLLKDSFIFYPEKETWLDFLESKLGEEFFGYDVARRLSAGFDLKNISSILVESPYVDKDYRSLYYNFFAKRGMKYGKFCVRMSFFSGAVKLNDGLLCYNDDCEYLGFIVLNPTYDFQFGRSVVSPKIIKNCSGFLLKATYKAHILGHDFLIDGFPFMSQPTTISVCAHASCWSIIRFFSQEFSDYSTKLIYEITTMASQHKQGGLIPSRGLQDDQAVKILSLAGFYPDTYTREGVPGSDFLTLLYSYIESGFPVYAGRPGHAFCIVGHGNYKEDIITQVDDDRIITTWDGINAFMINDDNHYPYKTTSDDDIKEINVFIVPLPEKIYFPSESVLGVIKLIIDGEYNIVDLSSIKKPVFRFFITTSYAYKRFIVKHNNQYPRNLVEQTVALAMPKFIWIVETSNTDILRDKKCINRMILDATAGQYDEEPPILILHDFDKAIIHDRMITKDLLEINLFNLEPFDQYCNNLHDYSV